MPCRMCLKPHCLKVKQSIVKREINNRGWQCPPTLFWLPWETDRAKRMIQNGTSVHGRQGPAEGFPLESSFGRYKRIGNQQMVQQESGQGTQIRKRGANGEHTRQTETRLADWNSRQRVHLVNRITQPTIAAMVNFEVRPGWAPQSHRRA